jgi:hypothetical protein
MGYSLDVTDLTFFLRDLKRQIDQFKPDDNIEFGLNYFKQVQSCTHVVGTGYSYVLESLHNRKSLIYCLLESLKGFEEQPEITPNELFHLIESLCPGFPRSIVLEAAMLSVTNINHIAQLVDTKCSFLTLFRFVACFVLYDEWIKVIEECFRNDGKGMFLQCIKLKSKIEDYYRNLPMSINQPPLAAILAASEADAFSTSKSAYDKEVSFDAFKKNLFNSPLIITELEIIAQLPLHC